MVTIIPIIIAGINNIVTKPIPKGINIIKTTTPTNTPRIVNNILKNITPTVSAAAIKTKKTTIPNNNSIITLLILFFIIIYNIILHIIIILYLFNLNVLNSLLEND